jgi:hypothetical protein
MFDDSFKGNSSVDYTVYYKVRRSRSYTRDMQKASAVFILFSCLPQARPALVKTIYLFIYLRLPRTWKGGWCQSLLSARAY